MPFMRAMLLFMEAVLLFMEEVLLLIDTMMLFTDAMLLFMGAFHAWRQCSGLRGRCCFLRFALIPMELALMAVIS